MRTPKKVLTSSVSWPHDPARPCRLWPSDDDDDDDVDDDDDDDDDGPPPTSPHMPDDDQGSTVQTPPPIMPLPILYNFHLFSTRPPLILAGIRPRKIMPI